MRRTQISGRHLSVPAQARPGSPVSTSRRTVLGKKRTMESGQSLRASSSRARISSPRRGGEFNEETNLTAEGELLALTPVNQKSGKLVHAFTIEADFELGAFTSNAFEIEWPPKSGKRQNFPEIDRIAYFALPAAKIKIIAYQLPLLLELEARVA